MVKGAILLVDNDPDILQHFGDLLRDEGYQVYPASNQEDALRLAYEKDVDITLVDVRLIDDDNPQDESGVKLSAALDPDMCRILHTGFERGEEWVKSVCFDGKANGYLLKDWPSEQRLVKIEEFCRQHVGLNPIAVFDLKGGLTWKSLGERASESINIAASAAGVPIPANLSLEELAGDVERLLRRLLPNSAVRAILYPMSSGQGGASVLEAVITREVAKLTETVVIKLGAKQIIEREESLYEKFVSPLPDESVARLRWRAYLQRLGAIAYSRVGAGQEDVVSLDTVRGCLVQEQGRALEIIRTFFETTCKVWYEAYRVATDTSQEKNLRTLYLGDHGLWYKAGEGHKALASARMQLPDGVNERGARLEFKIPRRSRPLSLPDPVQAALNENDPESEVTIRKLCVTHGDLHVRNILLVAGRNPRMIDFGCTGESHVFRDFAALEASLRFTCITCKDKRDLLSLEEALSQAEHLESAFDLNHVKSSGLLALAKVIREIRRLARDASGEDNLPSYLRGLMYYCLKYATPQSPDESEPPGRMPLRRWHALLTASLILQRLQQEAPSP
jgi:CheY-like chemotaxis protein